MANNNKNIEDDGIDTSTFKSSLSDYLSSSSILDKLKQSQDNFKVNAMPDYYTDYSYDYDYTTTRKNLTSTGGPVGWGTTTTGTTNMGHVHTHTGTTSIGGTHTHNLVYDSTMYQFYKQPFSKAGFINDVIVGGNCVKRHIESHIDNYTDDGLIDCLEFCDKFELLTPDLFWYAVSKNLVLYPLYTKYHEVDKCLEIIEREKNKNIIGYTAKNVKEDIEFKRGVNKLKLKGVL